MTNVTQTGSKGGMEGVVAAQTRLSDVRGLQGELIYAGYNIDDLAGKVTFEEVVHLLHEGRLPTLAERDALHRELADHRALPQGVLDLLCALPRQTPPMNAVRTLVSALGCHAPDSEDDSPEAQRAKALRLIAQIPVITASFHRARQGKPLIASDPELGEAANFLYLLGGERAREDTVNTVDLCYVLHADHGMNASTFSSRVTIATLSDIFSAICSAIGTLKGPLHGGANEGVIRMLREIGSIDGVEAYVDRVIEEKRKIMGFGHRVYKVLDPRAPHLRRMAHKLGRELGDSRWIEMSDLMARLMEEKKGIQANVDFYSASVYYSLGLPTDLFTPVFAIARTAGWTAHVLEQLSNNRLIRPESEYVGPSGLKVVPIEER